MTTPMDSAQALRFAQEVLVQVNVREDVPQDLRHQALMTLRHLLPPDEIEFLTAQKALSWHVESSIVQQSANDTDHAPEPRASSRMPWTAWLECEGDNRMISSFVAIGYAADKKQARAIFARHFGVAYAKRALITRGVVANEVTEPLISRSVFERMTIYARRRADFGMHARLDRAAPLKSPATNRSAE